MKKIALLLIMCIMVLTLLVTGCNRERGARGAVEGSAAIVTRPGQLPLVTEPITLTIGLPRSINVEDYATNYLTLYLQDKSGINLNFHPFATATADANTQFELMVSAGERLPDIIYHNGFADWALYGDNGVFIDLNPLHENWAYFYNQRMQSLDQAERDYVVLMTTAASGRRYAYPFYQQQFHNNFRSMNFINHRWLSQLGLSMPTTTEEFYRTLVAFRDMDSRNIPWIGGVETYGAEPFAFIINAFVYHPYRDASNWFLNATNGNLWAPWTTEEYREAMRYLNRLFSEGLIHISTFTNTTADLAALISYQPGETNRVGFFSAHHNQVFRPETPAIYDFQVQVSLTGPRGVNHFPLLPNTALPMGFITRDAAYPEAAFRFMDLLSDMQTSTVVRFGEENVDWRWVQNSYTALGLPAQIEVLNVLWGVPNNKHWNANPGIMMIESENNVTPGWNNDGSWMDDRAALLTTLLINDGKDVPETVGVILYTREEEDSIREIRTTIDSYREESFALFVTGQLNVDRDWDNYLSTLERMGLPRYLEVAQRAYTRTLELTR